MRALLVTVLLCSGVTQAKGAVWSEKLERGARLADLAVPAPMVVRYSAPSHTGTMRPQWTAANLELPVATRWCGVDLPKGTQVVVTRHWATHSDRGSEGTFLHFDLRIAKVITGQRVAAGHVTIECRGTEPARVVSAALEVPLRVGEHQLPARSHVRWYATATGGGIYSFTTPEQQPPWTIDGVEVPPGTGVMLHPNGRLAVLDHPRSPAEPIQIGRWRCELGESNNAQVHLHDTGELHDCFLIGVHQLGRWKVHADVVLHPDGTPSRIFAATPFEWMDRTWSEGTLVFFKADGTIQEIRGYIDGAPVSVRPD